MEITCRYRRPTFFQSLGFRPSQSGLHWKSLLAEVVEKDMYCTFLLAMSSLIVTTVLISVCSQIKGEFLTKYFNRASTMSFIPILNILEADDVISCSRECLSIVNCNLVAFNVLTRNCIVGTKSLKLRPDSEQTNYLTLNNTSDEWLVYSSLSLTETTPESIDVTSSFADSVFQHTTSTQTTSMSVQTSPTPRVRFLSLSIVK